MNGAMISGGDGAVDTTLLAISLNISPLQAAMVELFICRAVVTPGELREIVANVSVAVHRLRERLMRYGIKIENRYGIGYTMLPDSREIIKARVGQFAALNAA